MTAPFGTDLDQRATLEQELIRRRLARAARAGQAVARLPRGQGTQWFRVSPVEQQFWQLHQGDPSGAVFTTVGALEMIGPLDVTLLGRALNWLSARHEPLRTRYRQRDGELCAVVVPEQSLTIPVLPVTEAELDAATSAVFAEPFDLAEDPPVHLRLLRLAPDRHVAVLALHHIISDLRSIEIFCTELGLAYAAAAAGAQPPLAPLELQNVDVTEWRRARVERSAVQLTRYWRERLDGARPPLIPADLAPPAQPSFAGHTHTARVTDELIAELRQLGADCQASLFMVTLAVFAVLMGAYSNERDVLVNTPVSLRDRPELNGLLGILINYIPVRIDLSGDPTFRELLGRVRTAVAGDLDHALLPEPEIGAQHASGRLSVPVQFTEEADPAIPLAELAGLRCELVQSPPWPYAQGPFSFRVTAGAHGVHLILTYRLDLFTEARVTAIAADYLDLLVQVARNPDHKVHTPEGPCGVPLRVPPVTVGTAESSAYAVSE